ncbi:MAG: hypothetical protein ACO3VO_09510, partial [Ilumatobacteraceae bacterium]
MLPSKRRDGLLTVLLSVKLDTVALVWFNRRYARNPLVRKTLSAAPGKALPDQLLVLVHSPLLVVAIHDTSA